MLYTRLFWDDNYSTGTETVQRKTLSGKHYILAPYDSVGVDTDYYRTNFEITLISKKENMRKKQRILANCNSRGRHLHVSKGGEKRKCSVIKYIYALLLRSALIS